MMRMNAYEVDLAVGQAEGTKVPALIDAAVFLAAFKELINSISDGWAYWRRGTECSADLEELLYKGIRRIGPPPEVQEVAEAKKRVITFLRRCSQTKGKPEVLAFLKQHETRSVVRTVEDTVENHYRHLLVGAEEWAIQQVEDDISRLRSQRDAAQTALQEIMDTKHFEALEKGPRIRKETLARWYAARGPGKTHGNS